MIDTSKIIHAPVGGGRYTVTAPIIKEDYGLYLKIEGLELPSTYEVDFSNSEHHGTSVTMIGNADGVLIPRQFIDTGKDVFAFLYWVGEDYGKTVYKFRIPNQYRPDRTNEQPTPEEQSVIDQAINALNNAVEQTSQDVLSAYESAQNASASADRAERSESASQLWAETAENYSDSAEQSASQASASATASAQSASQSAQIKTDVEGMVDDAQASASASAQSATASANSASQASASATSAIQASSNASDMALSAQTYSEIAQSHATQAGQSAQTASAKATESAQSASQALTYKTDAESAKTASQTAQASAESARDSAISAQESAEDARDEAQALVDGISGKTEQIDSNTERIESLEDDRYKPYAVDSASGSIASFVDGADDIPLKSLIVSIDPVQDLHGYDSPWVAGGGVNQWDEVTELGTIDTTTGKNSANNSRLRSKNYVTVLPSTSYYYKSTTNDYLLFYDENKNYISGAYRTNSTFTTPSTAHFMRIAFNSSYGTAYNNDTSINYPSTVTTYSPYENICPISGWTGMQLQKTGVNIWNGTLGNNVFVSFPTKVGVQYSVSAKMVDSTQSAYLYVRKRTVGDTSTGTVFKYIIADKTVSPQTFTAEAGYEYGLWSNAKYTNVTDVQIEIGSSATAYKPYQGQTIPITWQTEAGTVYGGQLDVLSGVLRVTHKIDEYVGNEAWADITSPTETTDRTYLSMSGTNALSTVVANWLKTVPVASASNSIPWSAYINSSNRILVHFPTGEFANVDAWKAYLAEHHLQVLYSLATPIEIQLTPHDDIKSLLGTNNIFADTGDTSTEYRADTTLYISRLTEPDADMIADANIVSGQYFMVGNSLYKATANIASGASVIVGTNAIRKSLSEALNEINS